MVERVDSGWDGFHKKNALSHSLLLGMGQSWEGRSLQGQQGCRCHGTIGSGGLELQGRSWLERQCGSCQSLDKPS